MKNALLGAVVLLAVGCGAYQFPGSSPTTGTVSGRVIAVPCAPVEAAQNACVARPITGLQINFQNNTAVESTTTNSNGDYSIDLASGTWKVSFKTYMHLVSGPTSVTVTPGSTVTANYVLDSGIRFPPTG